MRWALRTLLLGGSLAPLAAGCGETTKESGSLASSGGNQGDAGAAGRGGTADAPGGSGGISAPASGGTAGVEDLCAGRACGDECFPPLPPECADPEVDCAFIPHYCDTDGQCLAWSVTCGAGGEAGRGSLEPLTAGELGRCSDDSECIVVPYQSCCGATKRAINAVYLEAYNAHPEWQVLDDPATCAVIGACRDDTGVVSAVCERDPVAYCSMVYPSG